MNPGLSYVRLTTSYIKYKAENHVIPTHHMTHSNVGVHPASGGWRPLYAGRWAYSSNFVIHILFFTFGPSAGCPECICNRPRPWSRPCISDWGCGAVILLSRGEFGREKNKICYQRGVSEPIAVCQIYNIILLFYSTFSFCAIIGVNDRILYLIYVHLHETGSARPRFVYLVYFLEIFAKKKSPFTPTTFVAHLQKKYYSNLLPSYLVCIDS